MSATKPRTTTEALKKLALAEYKRAQAQVLSRLNDPIGAHFERADATTLDEAAQAALATPDPLPVVREGGEAILTRYPDPTDDRYADWFVDTLRTPHLVRATASLERLRLAQEVGCVELAQDAAEHPTAEQSGTHAGGTIGRSALYGEDALLAEQERQSERRRRALFAASF